MGGERGGPRAGPHLRAARGEAPAGGGCGADGVRLGGPAVRRRDDGRGRLDGAGGGGARPVVLSSGVGPALPAGPRGGVTRRRAAGGGARAAAPPADRLRVVGLRGRAAISWVVASRRLKSVSLGHELLTAAELHRVVRPSGAP